MPRYAITEKAGRFVAGQNNTGVGTILTLTEKQAEHEVRLGSLQPLDGPAVAAEPDDAKKATPAKGKKASKADPKPTESEAVQGGAGDGASAE
jgi:hypothetical protein